MQDFLLIPLMGASMLAPSLVCLVVAAILRHSAQKNVLAYAIGAVLWLVFVACAIGLNAYAYTLHPDWWRDGEHIMIVFDVTTGIFALLLGWYATSLLLPEFADNDDE